MSRHAVAWHRLPRRERGVTMIEVLITIVVVATGLLGVAGMQILGMRATNDAHQQTLATQLAQDIMERVRTNRVGADGGFYSSITLTTSSTITDPDCVANICTAAELAAHDQAQWIEMIKPTTGAPILPETTVQLQCCTAGNFTILLQWGPGGAHTLSSEFRL